MHWTTILFLISLVLKAIIWYLLTNSHFPKTRENPEIPFKMPLILWILFVLITFIPAINVVSDLIYIILIFVNYLEGDLEFNEDFWLAKEY